MHSSLFKRTNNFVNNTDLVRLARDLNCAVTVGENGKNFRFKTLTEMSRALREEEANEKQKAEKKESLGVPALPTSGEGGHEDEPETEVEDVNSIVHNTPVQAGLKTPQDGPQRPHSSVSAPQGIRVRGVGDWQPAEAESGAMQAVSFNFGVASKMVKFKRKLPGMTPDARARRARRNATIATLRAPEPLLPSPCAPVYVEEEMRNGLNGRRSKAPKRSKWLGSTHDKRWGSAVRWFDAKEELRSSLNRDAHAGSVAADRNIRQLAAMREGRAAEDARARRGGSRMATQRRAKSAVPFEGRAVASTFSRRPTSAWSCTSYGTELSEVEAWRERTVHRQDAMHLEPETPQETDAEEIFRIADCFVRDGQLCAAECKAFLANTRFADFVEWLTEGMYQFSNFDADHNGTLDMEELEAALAEFHASSLNSTLESNVMAARGRVAPSPGDSGRSAPQMERAKSAGASVRPLSSTEFQDVITAQRQRIAEATSSPATLGFAEEEIGMEPRTLEERFPGSGGWASTYLQSSPPPKGQRQRAMSAIGKHS